MWTFGFTSLSRGESYAGIYVPTLVSAISAHNTAIGKGASGNPINLKGFAVSNDSIIISGY